jgi:serine/threonine protein kinase
MKGLMEQMRQALGDDFEIVRPLGEGRYADVFLARERTLDRPVAVKVLRAAMARDDTARARFLREARLSAKIHHPNVVEVYRVGELEPDGRPYLVMEYIDGVTFDDILAAGGPMSEDEVRRVLTDVCGALDAAHGLGIIHRDVRPGNIMRTRDGARTVLTDFGLAGILETGGEGVTRLTGAGQILGDPRYAPPEQLQGETIRPGSDLYALAATAYDLLTGKGPFPEETRQSGLIRAHLGSEPTPIRRIRAEVSPGLEDLLLRCLQKRADHRPSASLLRTRLSVGADDAVRPEGAVESFLFELKRRRVYKVGAAYGAFILVVLAFVDAALPALPFPVADWADTVLVTGALVGLPVTLVLAWFYDLTAGGVERTASMPGDSPRGVRVLQVAGVILVLVLVAVGLLAWLFLLR